MPGNSHHMALCQLRKKTAQVTIQTFPWHRGEHIPERWCVEYKRTDFLSPSQAKHTHCRYKASELS